MLEKGREEMRPFDIHIIIILIQLLLIILLLLLRIVIITIFFLYIALFKEPKDASVPSL